MKKYLYYMLATAVLLVMTSFTKSTLDARVESAFVDNHFFVVQQPAIQVAIVEERSYATLEYNYQPQEKSIVFVTNNEEFCQVPGGVQIIKDELFSYNSDLYTSKVKHYEIPGDTKINDPWEGYKRFYRRI